MHPRRKDCHHASPIVLQNLGDVWSDVLKGYRGRSRLKGKCETRARQSDADLIDGYLSSEALLAANEDPDVQAVAALHEARERDKELPRPIKT